MLCFYLQVDCTDYQLRLVALAKPTAIADLLTRSPCEAGETLTEADSIDTIAKLGCLNDLIRGPVAGGDEVQAAQDAPTLAWYSLADNGCRGVVRAAGGEADTVSCDEMVARVVCEIPNPSYIQPPYTPGK